MNNKENFNSFPQTEEFPFPKLVKTFDFFFPQEKHSKNIFTMENLRRFGPKAPILGFLILIGIFVWTSIDATDNDSAITACCMVAGLGALILGTAKYLWWLVMAILAKLARRNPVICLAMTVSGPLQALAISCIVHFVGLICRLIWLAIGDL